MKYLYFLITMLMLATVSLGKLSMADQVPAAINLMKNKKWEEAQEQWQKIVDKYADKGERLFGDMYGLILYNKGYSELQIAKGSQDEATQKEYFQKASDSMKESFEINMRANKAHPKSLLYMGRAEQGLGNMERAIELYKLFEGIQRP